MKKQSICLVLLLLLSACVGKKKFEELADAKSICTSDLKKVEQEKVMILEKMTRIENNNQEQQLVINQQKGTLADLEKERDRLILSKNELDHTLIKLDSVNSIAVVQETTIRHQQVAFNEVKANLKKVVEAVDPIKFKQGEEPAADWWNDAAYLKKISRNAAANRSYRVNQIKPPADTLKQYHLSSGNIALYCPDRMVYKNTYDVMSIMADLISDEEIRQVLVEQIREHEPEITDEAISSETLIKKIDYYNLVELDLTSSIENGFEINPVHANKRQRVTDNMEGWHWKVTPLSEEPKQQLLLKAIVFDPAGKRVDSFTRTFKVDVEVDLSKFLHKAKMLFVEDPAWAFGTLIIPLLTFLWGLFTGKRRRVKQPTS